MSAFEAFDQERQAIDSLLLQGYTITGIFEDLDGARVRFERKEPAGETAELQLLTADARKHVTTLIFGGSRPAASIEAHT